MVSQPRTQGLSSWPPLLTTKEAEKRDPGDDGVWECFSTAKNV